jgi:hypothetical protein
MAAGRDGQEEAILEDLQDAILQRRHGDSISATMRSHKQGTSSSSIV